MCFRIIRHGVSATRCYVLAVIFFPMSAVAWNGIVCVAAALQGYAEVFKYSPFAVLHTENAKKKINKRSS